MRWYKSDAYVDVNRYTVIFFTQMLSVPMLTLLNYNQKYPSPNILKPNITLFYI